MFSLVWSVGGSCDTESREKFSEFVRETVSGKSEKHPIPARVGNWDCPMNEEGLVYDYYYEVLCDSDTEKGQSQFFIQASPTVVFFTV